MSTFGTVAIEVDSEDGINEALSKAGDVTNLDSGVVRIDIVKNNGIKGTIENPDSVFGDIRGDHHCMTERRHHTTQHGLGFLYSCEVVSSMKCMAMMLINQGRLISNTRINHRSKGCCMWQRLGTQHPAIREQDGDSIRIESV